MSASGASVVKHGLNPEKGFMQVHYLKVSVSDGYSVSYRTALLGPYS